MSSSHISRRVKTGIAKSVLERPLFLGICKEIGIDEPVTEWQYARPRKWAFDYAWPEHRVALEVEGGGWIAGGHNSGQGFLEDIERYNAAAERGWLVVRCVPGGKDTIRYRKNKAGERTGVAWIAPALLNMATARMVERVILARKNPPPVVGAQQRGFEL